MKKVLVIGGGGREHAIVDAISRSPQVGKIYCAPGNAGIAQQAECVAIKDTDVEGLKNFALEKMQGATIISPNESETKALTGIFPVDEKAILEASKILLERSKAKYIVLKLGERGCSVWDGERLTILPAYKSNVVDTTAAGDCFTAALALEYVRTGDIYSSCDFGNKAGAIAVSRMGAAESMPTAEAVLDFE